MNEHHHVQNGGTLRGDGYADSPEEMFIKLRDAVLECGYYVQHVKLDAHYQDVQISQAPEGGLFNNKSVHVFPLRENDSIREENAKSEQTSVDPHDPADDSQSVG